jgi:hypothetical protein
LASRIFSLALGPQIAVLFGMILNKHYISAMKVTIISNLQLGGAATPALSSADLYSIAKARFIPNTIANVKQPAATDKHAVYINQYASGSSLFNTLLTEAPAGTQEEESVDFPGYFPVATKGSECAAVVSSLTWANKNLFPGYEFIWLLFSATPASNRYFVSGVLNSSQTQANDPFGTQGQADGLLAGQAACWASGYTDGLNPW